MLNYNTKNREIKINHSFRRRLETSYKAHGVHNVNGKQSQKEKVFCL